LADYTGDFVNPGYGRVSISKGEPGGDRPLTMTLNRMTRPLSHFHYDTFSTPPDPLDPLEKTVVSFQTDLKGDISSVSIPLEPNVKAIEFVRVAEKRMSERSFLEPFVGKYDVAGTILTVAMEGDSTLTIGDPGAPPRRLVPKHGTLFDINGLPGQSVEFRPGEMVLYGPGSASVFKRQ
jgi:hypothetical protein